MPKVSIHEHITSNQAAVCTTKLIARKYDCQWIKNTLDRKCIFGIKNCLNDEFSDIF
jgi:hypothetical protein